MKKSWLFLLASVLTFGGITQTEATIIRTDGVLLTHREPIEVLITDSYGNTYRQIVDYDPLIGGIDIDTGWAGPYASIYLPAWGIGYVWYNGYWVDESGYYWDGPRRVYIDYPEWNNYWVTYWGKVRRGDRDGHWWYKHWHGDHDGRWQRDHGHDRYDEHWQHDHGHDRYDERWQRDRSRDRDYDGRQRRGEFESGRGAEWKANDKQRQRGFEGENVRPMPSQDQMGPGGTKRSTGPGNAGMGETMRSRGPDNRGPSGKMSSTGSSGAGANSAMHGGRSEGAKQGPGRD